MIKLFAHCTATGHYLLAATNSGELSSASLAQLAEHALRKRMVVGSIPTGGFIAALTPALHVSHVSGHTAD